MAMDVQTLTRLLWPQGNGPEAPQVYAILDGARDEAIAPAVWLSNLPYVCLYAGTLTPALQRAAPYLVHLAPESDFFRVLVESGWGQAWGVYIVAEADVTLKALRRHFRTLLQAKDEKGQILLFRFYDPRVVKVYLSTCTPREIACFLGPVNYVAYESFSANKLQSTSRINNFDAADAVVIFQEKLKIRYEQITKFENAAEEYFLNYIWLENPNNLRLNFNHKYENFISRGFLLIQEAKLLGFASSWSIASYITIVASYGSRFFLHPSVAVIFNQKELSQDVKMQLVFKLADSVWREAREGADAWKP